MPNHCIPLQKKSGRGIFGLTWFEITKVIRVMALAGPESLLCNRVERIWLQDDSTVVLSNLPGNRPDFIKVLQAASSNLNIKLDVLPSAAAIKGKHAVIKWNLIDLRSYARAIPDLGSQNCTQRLLILYEPPAFTHNYVDFHFHRCFNSTLLAYDDCLCKEFQKFVVPRWFGKFLKIPDHIAPSHRPFYDRLLCGICINSKYSLHPTERWSTRRACSRFMEQATPENFGWHSHMGLGPSSGRYPVPFVPNFNGISFIWMQHIQLSTRCFRAAVPFPLAAKGCENYKFVICYENQFRPGWISERIFQALFGGAVPVYWGAPNIEDYIPRGCYIDRRDFKSNEELLEFMKNFTEEDYKLHRRFVEDFYKSDSFLLFSPENFAETILSAIFPDGYDRQMAFPGEQYEMVRRAKRKMYTMGLVSRDKVAWAL